MSSLDPDLEVWAPPEAWRPPGVLPRYLPGCASPCTYGWGVSLHSEKQFLLLYLQQTRVHQVTAMATHSRKGYSYLDSGSCGPMVILGAVVGELWSWMMIKDPAQLWGSPVHCKYDDRRRHWEAYHGVGRGHPILQGPLQVEVINSEGIFPTLVSSLTTGGMEGLGHL